MTTTGTTTTAATGTRRRARPAAVLVAVLALVTALTGCGLRLETPPPAEPSPDAVEQVRARAVDDSLALVDVATRAMGAQSADDAGSDEDGDDPVAAVLTDVVTFATAHAEQLGGEYVSGLSTPTPTPTPVRQEPADAQDVLDLLTTTAATAATDADAVTDGPLARLLGSIGTARAQLAARLVVAAGLTAPEMPEATATPTTEPEPSVTTTPTPGGSASPEPVEVSGDALTDLVLTHDQAGFALEVVAAHRADAAQDATLAQAQRHRAAAQELAAAAGIDGTDQDPRLAAYALPAGIDDPDVQQALGRSSELAVAAAYANAVAAAPAGGRSAYLTGLRDASAAALTWGATPVAFPGLPEQSPTP